MLNDIRDLIYVNYDNDLDRVISYGIEFKEFIQSLSKKPNNILVLKGDYGSAFDFTTNCEYCIGEDIDEFIEEDVYSYGDFSWIDFDKINNLKTLEKQEVAELFYVSKMWEPINDTYYKKINNRFIYVAHDDGWINYTYYNNVLDYQEILSNVIVNKIKKIYDIHIDFISKEIMIKLCELSMIGIAIDLLRLCVEEDNSITVPIYMLGVYKDMDEVYRLSRESEVEVAFELKYNVNWKLIKVIK